MKHMTKKSEVGKQGEDTACDYLEKAQYLIIERNFTCRLGEVDIIARKNEYLVFCEVKSRQANAGIHPSLSVTRAKAAKLRKLGLLYIDSHKYYSLQPRFDVISVLWREGDQAEIEHFENAF